MTKPGSVNGRGRAMAIGGRCRLALILGALLWAASVALPGTASANHIPNAPECSDMHDNDGDGVVDFPQDSDCTGLTDDSEGIGQGGSELFVTFLTQWDNGSGGAPDVVCEQSIPVQSGITAGDLTLIPVDVNTDCGTAGADVSVGARVPLNLDANQPTIKVNRLTSGPLPLRVEVVAVDPDKPAWRNTIGYDALHSSAPATFQAALDLSNRDEKPNTREIKVTQTVTGPAAELALISETFKPEGTLTNRKFLTQSRVNFRSAGAGTQVPVRVDIDIFAARIRQRVGIVRSAQPTVVDFLIAEPNNDPLISGTFDRLPPKADVTVQDTDSKADRDPFPDTREIIYDANEPVAGAQVYAETVRRIPKRGPVVVARGRHSVCDLKPCGPPQRLTIGTRINGLPGVANTPQLTEDARIVYAAGDDTVNYSASGRATSGHVTVTDEAPLFGRARYVDVDLTGVPRRVKANLSKSDFEFSTADPGGIGVVNLRALQAPPPPKQPDLCRFITCEDGVALTDNPATYRLSAQIHRLKAAEVKLAPEVDVRVDTAPEMVVPDGCQYTICRRGQEQRANPPVPVWRTPFGVNLDIPRKAGDFAQGQQTISGRIVPLKPDSRLLIGPGPTGYNQVLYTNGRTDTGTGPEIKVDALNFPGLPTGKNGVQARDMHVNLTHVPRRVQLTYRKRRNAGDPGGFPINLNTGSTNGSIGKFELQLTSGADERLPVDECAGGSTCPNYRRLDGLLMRDDPSKYVIFVRLTSLRGLDINKFGDGRSEFLVGDLRVGGADPDRVLRIDSQTHGPSQIGSGTQVMSETMTATLEKLPRRVELRMITGPVRTELDYEAPEVVEGFEYEKNVDFSATHWANRHETLRVTPMPRELLICRQERRVDCAENVFDEHIEWARNPRVDNYGIPELDPDRGSSLRIHSVPESYVGYFSQPAQGSPLFSQLGLTVNDLWLQQDGDAWDCGIVGTRCKRGYIGLDTGWDPADEAAVDGDLHGQIQSYDSRMKMPVGFAAKAQVMAFEQTGATSGQLLTKGNVVCPSGTEITTGPDDQTEKFCKGNILVDLARTR